MAAGSTTALLGPRRKRWGRSRPTALIAVLAAVALAAVTSMVGRELVNIQSLATDVQSKVLPQIMAGQQRAIWIESLRSAASVVVFAPEPATRHQALAKAEQLATNVTYADAASRDGLEQAWASIRLAADKADEAQRIGQKMDALLSEADGLIGDMSANLSSIVEDSGSTLARVIKDATSENGKSPWSRQTLEEVLAINVTSQELLASLERGRIILSSALSLASDRELTSAQTHFVAVGAQLQARVETLRGNSDYEYLPAMIERFTRLDVVFDYQQTKLSLQQEALSASDSAKLQLGVVRENLAAHAAGAADSSIAQIAASAGRIKITAAAMLICLIMVVAVPLVRNWQDLKAVEQADPAAQAKDQTGSPAGGMVDGTVASLESLIKAQGNLEHWRQTLIVKLNSAIAGALRQVAKGTPRGAADQGSPEAEFHEAHRDLGAVEPALPADVAPQLEHIVGLIEDVAARIGLAGLEASLDGVRMIAGVGPDRRPGGAAASGTGADPADLPSGTLLAAAKIAEAVTIRVGTTISEINAIATRPEPDLTQATNDILSMIAQLAEALAAIRDQVEPNPFGAWSGSSS